MVDYSQGSPKHIPTSFQGIVNIFKSYGRLHQHLSLSRFSRPSADWWVSICLITSAHIGSRVQIFERVHWAADKFCQIANMSSRLWSIKVSIRESWHTFEPNQSILAAFLGWHCSHRLCVLYLSSCNCKRKKRSRKVSPESSEEAAEEGGSLREHYTD